MENILSGVVTIAALFLLMGIIQLFARDTAWAMAQWQNGMFGRSSERTAAWERWRVFGGVLSILCAVGLGLMAVKAVEIQNERAAVETVRQQRQQLDADFRDLMWILKGIATTEPQEYTTSDMRVKNAEESKVYYGKCRNNDGFYLLIVNHWGGLGDLLYSTRSTFCVPDDLYPLTTEPQLMGISVHGGNWYRF